MIIAAKIKSFFNNKIQFDRKNDDFFTGVFSMACCQRGPLASSLNYCFISASLLPVSGPVINRQSLVF